MDQLTKEEYEKKRIEIIEKFTKEFQEKGAKGHAMTIKIIECLIRGENPYNIIEILIKNQDELIDKLHEMAIYAPSKPILLKDN